MATYSASQLGIKPPPGGFKEGGWYNGRQYIGGTFSDPGVIHQASSQQGAGQAVSAEVNAQSAKAQGVSTQQFNNYLQQQSQQTAPAALAAPSKTSAPTGLPSSSGVSGSTAGLGITAPEVINLPQIYQKLYDSSGIKAMQDELTMKQKAYNDAQLKINDNPFLSEATRVGRIQKLTQDYTNNIKTVQDQIATKQADIETQVNLQTKQFDINSQAAQQAMSQFNSLLQMGALDSASGEDIANLTRSTGISSTMIQSAIDANKAKNVDTTIMQFDDGTNQGFAVVDAKTGEIINTQTIAGSKPKASGGSVTERQQTEKLQNQVNAASDAGSGATLQQLINHYVPPLSVDEVYRIYNSNTTRGQAKESLAQAKQGVFANQKGFQTEAQTKAKAKAASKTANDYSDITGG
jgi:hypothetical protein